MSDYNTVDYSIDNGICTIALNRPDVLNAMNRQLIDETALVFGDKPVAGAINGWAVGGGFSWAVNCDFPIWARGARGFLPDRTTAADLKKAMELETAATVDGFMDPETTRRLKDF